MTVLLEWFLANAIEMLAFAFGIAGVWLTAKQNIWCWLTGLVGVVLTLIVSFYKLLYPDVILQVFYIVITIYGWYNWLHGGENKSVLKVRRIKMSETIVILIVGFTASGVVGWIFSTYTKSAMPYTDSFVAVWSVIGTWAMARKIIENWLMWLVIDTAYTGIYIYQDLYFFALQNFIFIILAVYGFVKWRKEYIKRGLAAA